jgi:drug/metabolite transporter (DMT)-like permease
MPFPFYGELMALLTTLSWTICIFPFTEASRRLGPNTVNHYRLLLAVILLSIVLIVFNGFSLLQLFYQPHLNNWIWLGLSGIIGLTLGDYFGFTMYAIIGTRLGSLFASLSPGAALLFAYILLGETINYIGIIGIIITSAGVAWISLSKAEHAQIPDYGHGKISKGILFGVLSAICQGVGLVLAKKGFYNPESATYINPIHATWIRMIIATITIFAITIAAGKLKQISIPIIKNQNKGIMHMIAGTVFGPVMGVSLSLYTISVLNVSMAQTIFSLVPVFVLPIAYWLYKERITLKSFIGAVIATLGVVLLVWRENIQQFLN